MDNPVIQSTQRQASPPKPPVYVRPVFQPAPPCQVRHNDVTLCYATAIGCALFGAVGTAYYWSRGEGTDLTALLVAGGAYFIMGASKQLQYRFRGHHAKQADAGGH